jgi:sec-independent protein translocase protein TatA
MLLALIGPLGLPELLIILFILVLIFGAKRLSGLGRGLGQGIKGFKQEMKEFTDADPHGDKDLRREEAEPASRRGSAR